MSHKADIFRAECSKDFILPPCPHCGGKVYIEDIAGFRVNHFCKKPKADYQMRTKFCKTPEEAVELYLKGDYEYGTRYELTHRHLKHSR